MSKQSLTPHRTHRHYEDKSFQAIKCCQQPSQQEERQNIFKTRLFRNEKCRLVCLCQKSYLWLCHL